MQHNRAIENNTFYGSVHINQGDTSNSGHGGDNSRCLVDLRVTDPRHDKARIEQFKGGLLRDSYHWILAHANFQQWRDDDSCRLLWIRGDPGKGKTMLLCGIIDELSPATRLKDESASTLLSFFLCQATDLRINSATNVLRGLIYLIVVQQPEMIAHVQKHYKHAGEKLFYGVNAWTALSDIFDNILRDPCLQDTYLVIDALDECVEGLPLLLDLIVQQSSAARVKWIVSSRSWPTIVERMNAASQMVMLYLELNHQSISAAVRSYIQHKVDQIAKIKAYDEKTRDAVADHLTSNANDTFLWVALVCQNLERVPRWKKPKLDTFPPGLDALYERMIKKIYQMEDLEDVDLCKRILACATSLYRPITLKELATLVDLPDDIPEDFLKDIIALCGSFLTIPKDLIYFIHQSAKDFLLGSAVDDIFPNGIQEVHYNVFSQSLQSMSEKLCRDIYKLHSPGIHIAEIKRPDPDPLAAINYSCVYWVDHLRDSRKNHGALSDDGLIDQFFRQKFLYWLEALILLRRITEGITAVKRLDALLQEWRKPSRLTSIVNDARRFIMYHKFGIENNPLQVYASALVFSPPRSIIRGLFKHEEPKWIVTGPAIEEDWSACLQTLEGHISGVSSVAFSPDSKLVASGSYDKTVRLWAADTGAPLQTLKGHDGSVRSVAFSPNSQLVASGSRDCTVRFWAADTGTPLQTLKGHSSAVYSVVFSRDSRLVASASKDRTIRIWAADTGAPLQTLEGHNHAVYSVDFSADSQLIASASEDGTVRLWATETGAPLKTFYSNAVNSVAFSPDSKLIASGSRDCTVRLWAAETGAPLQTLVGHIEAVYSVAFSPDSKLIASASNDRTIRLWAADTGAPLQTLEGHNNDVYAVAFSPDSKLIASGSNDRTIRLWAADTGAPLQTFDSHSNTVHTVAFSPDSKLVASGSRDYTVRLWAADTGAPLQTLEGHSDSVFSVVFSPDSKLVASASSDNTVRLWTTDTGAPLQTLEGHSDAVYSVAFSPDSKLVASGSDDGTIRLWASDTGTPLQTLAGPSIYAKFVAFSPDSKLVALASHNGTIWLWATHIPLQTLEGHSNTACPVAFLPDSKLVASGSSDDAVRFWPADTGAPLQTLKGHSHAVCSIAFSRDSKLVASASEDCTVRLWAVDTGAPLQTLEGHADTVDMVAFSPDSELVVSTSYDLTVRLWATDTGALLQTFDVGTMLYRVEFDATAQHILTDLGALPIDFSQHYNVAKDGFIPDQSLSTGNYTYKPGAYSFGYDVHPNKCWVTLNGQNMLWLPANYRPGYVGRSYSALAIGCESGRVLIMRFQELDGRVPSSV